MHTAVWLRLPSVSVSKRRSGVIRRRRTRLMLVFTSSMNPSRGPLTVMEVCGSLMARRVTFLVPRMIAPQIPSMRRAGLPDKISFAAAATSSALLISGNRSSFSASSRVAGAGERESGRAASSPKSCLSVIPSV